MVIAARISALTVRGHVVRIVEISGRFAVYLGTVCLTDDEEGPFRSPPSIDDIADLMDFPWVATKVNNAARLASKRATQRRSP